MDVLKSVQPLIDSFYQAINLRQLLLAEELLNQLREQANMQPALRPWCDHYAAVLLTEHKQDWAQAEHIFSKLLVEVGESDPLLKGKNLFELGICLHYQGRWLESVRVCEESLPILATVGEWSDQAFVHKQIALNYRHGFLNGDLASSALEQAFAACQQALNVMIAIPNPPAYVVEFKGVITNLLGELHLDLQQWDKAIDCFDSFLHTSQTLQDNFGISLAYDNLGEAHERIGTDSWAQAVAAYELAWTALQAIEGGHTHRIGVLTHLGFIHQKMRAFERARDYYGQAIAEVELLRASASSELVRASFFGNASQIYAWQALVAVELGDLPSAFNAVEQARARTLLDSLSNETTEWSSQPANTVLNLDWVQARLPTDALILYYFTTGLIELHEGRKSLTQRAERYRFPPAKTLLFAITREAINIIDCALSPNALRPRDLDNLVERHFLTSNIRRLLYDKLIQPVAHICEAKRRIYIVPHGSLHYIPFNALLAPDGKTLLQEEGPELVYAPSVSVLFNQIQPHQSSPDNALLAIGHNGIGSSRLRFAEDEAKLIANKMGGIAVSGPLVKQMLLSSQAGNYRLVHFACHGDFDPLSPLQSSLQIAQGDLLTGQEVLEQMKLSCELVILSACQSGLNRVRRGDELYGFMRAFLIAGARALLASLWRVDEYSTLLLMHKFYQAVQVGTGFATALHQAQIYLKGLPRHAAITELTAIGIQVSFADLPGNPDGEWPFADPKYWAPFILICEPSINLDSEQSQ